MSEQDDFLIGNNQLDDSLLMDVAGSMPEQSASNTAERKSGGTAERDTSLPDEHRDAATGGHTPKKTAKRQNGKKAGRSHAGKAEHQTSEPAEQPDASPFGQPAVAPSEKPDAGQALQSAVSQEPQTNSETAEQSASQQSEPEHLDIDAMLADPWGDSPDMNGETAEQSDGGTDSWNDGETAGKNTVEPTMEEADVWGDAPEPDGMGASGDSSPDPVWDDGETVGQENGDTANRYDGGTEDQSDDDIWGAVEPEPQENGEAANPGNDETDIWGDGSGTVLPERSDSETDIWGDMPAAEPSNRQNGEPAMQENSEADIWGDGGEERRSADMPPQPVSDDVWDDDGSIWGDETAEQPTSETADSRNGGTAEQSAADPGIWDTGAQYDGDAGTPSEQYDASPVDQSGMFPEQRFDGELADYADNPDEDKPETNGRMKRIAALAVAVLAVLALACGGAWYAYSSYTHAREEAARQAEIQERKDSLDKAQNRWDNRVADAKALVSEIKSSPVKDEKVMAGECGKLSKAATGDPMTEEEIGRKLKALDKQYKATETVYRKALDVKAKDVSGRLSELIGKAEKLSDAPDSSDKKTMNSLVKQWKGKAMTGENVGDAIKAVNGLQSAVPKVDKAKTDAENAKKAEEARKQAEENAKRQAAQQQQQQSQQSYTPQYQYSYTPRRQYSYTPQQQYTAPKQQQSTPSTPRQSTPSQPSTGNGNSGGSNGNSGVMF